MCLVENNSRHASNPCIQKGPEVSSSETNDRLPELPRDVLLLILSSFTTKEVKPPKMVCFRYRGKHVELNIRNAVSLSSVFIGAGPGEDIMYAFDHLAMYLPQLEALSLEIPVADLASELTVGVKLLKFPVLTTLKVLDISIVGNHSSSFLPWTPLIEACPALEKLTFKADCYDCGLDWKILDRRDGSPLVSLKTLEILSYAGRRLDIELAVFIFENAINLQEVIVQVASVPPYKRLKPLPPARISILKEMVPPGVAFILVEP